MNIAYLILVHRNPRLLERTIQALSYGDNDFFVHVDRKSDLREFSRIAGANVFLCEQRVPVYWGEFSQVEATIGLMRQARTHSARYGYFILLQGSDYPLRSGGYIQGFLEQNSGSEFISMVRIPAPGYPLSKIDRIWFTADQPVRRFASRVFGKIGLACRDHRKYLGSLEPYAGDACWALSRDACEYTLEYASDHPWVGEYFRNTFTPDEMFVHTILGNSKFCSRVRRSLLYRDFSIPGRHPAMLNDAHIRSFEAREKVSVKDQFGSGEVLFARKFSDDNLHLLDRIDTMIKRKGDHDQCPCSLSPEF